MSLPEEDISLAPDTSTAFFRILQESLTNIVRHAKASRVSVQLRSDNHITALQVQDNGVGIPAHVVAGPASFGLLSMKERALMLGGTVDVVSAPGAGTKIVVRVPHAAREDEHVQP